MPAGDPPLTLRDLREIELARLKGVGAALEARLADMGLHTVLDLLQHYPRRWIDRTKRVEIAALEVGEEATVIGEVRSVHGRRTRNGKALVEVVIHDGSSLLNVTFFNQAWREKQLAVGTEVSLFGKLDVYRGKRQMTMPVVDVLGRAGRGRRQDRRDPAGLPAVGEGRGVHVAAARAGGRGAREVRAARLRRPGRRRAARPRTTSSTATLAMRAIHRPDSMAEQARRREAPEVRRVPAHAGGPRRAQARARGAGVGDPPRGRRPARARVPRAAAVRAHRRPARARSPRSRTTWPATAPMHRLLQGDVGSGKTVVALAALLVAVQGGYQGAFMAPTEVLAEQHYLGSVKLLEGLTVGARGLAARRPAGPRRAAHEPHDRGRAPPHREGSRAPTRSTSSSARTRCSTATPSSPSSASR